MTKLTTVYNAIISQTTTLFSTKTRLHNPYQVLENPEIVRKDAWGIKVLDANKEVLEHCSLTVKRNYTLILVKQFVSLVGKEDGFDAVSLNLMEAQQSFCQLVNSPSELGVDGSVDQIDINKISGINQIVDNEKKYLSCEVGFTITISELIS